MVCDRKEPTHAVQRRNECAGPWRTRPYQWISPVLNYVRVRLGLAKWEQIDVRTQENPASNDSEDNLDGLEKRRGIHYVIRSMSVSSCAMRTNLSNESTLTLVDTAQSSASGLPLISVKAFVSGGYIQICMIKTPNSKKSTNVPMSFRRGQRVYGIWGVSVRTTGPLLYESQIWL